MPAGSNYRVFYPIHYVALSVESATSGTPIHGVQSVNLTTTFNLEQVFELGQLDIYENIENLPNIEMTIEKVLDGYPLIYHLATRDATSKTLLNRTNRKCNAVLSIFSDDQDNSSGTPKVQAFCSGMYVNSINYTLPVQGQCKESITLIGNDKLWVTSSGQVWNGVTGYAFKGHFNGGDSPASGTQRRQHVVMGAASANGSVWPTVIPGLTIAGGSGYNIESAGAFGAHIQDVSISVNLGREDLFELGRRRPYYRYANFPTAVDCTINMTAGGTSPGDAVNAISDSESNLSNEPIVIKLKDGTIFDLGIKNKLQSVSYSGGETGGGVVGIAYQFQNFNKLDVTQPSDPAGFLPN